jgi:hypothetical protein
LALLAVQVECHKLRSPSVRAATSEKSMLPISDSDFCMVIVIRPKNWEPCARAAARKEALTRQMREVVVYRLDAFAPKG